MALRVFNLQSNNKASVNETNTIVRLKLSSKDLKNIKNESNNQFNKNNTEMNSGLGFLEEFDTMNDNEFTDPLGAYDVPSIDQDVSNKLNKILLNYVNTPNKFLTEEINIKAFSVFKNLGSWPVGTDINCWWCHHPFKTVPCAIPSYVENGTFYCTGCFCSFNCALAYVYDSNKNINTSIALLKSLHQNIKGFQLPTDCTAPDWRQLKSYGGSLSIEQFRSGAITLNNSAYIPFPLKYIETDISISNGKKKPFIDKPTKTNKSGSLKNYMK